MFRTFVSSSSHQLLWHSYYSLCSRVGGGRGGRGPAGGGGGGGERALGAGELEPGQPRTHRHRAAAGDRLQPAAGQASLASQYSHRNQRCCSYYIVHPIVNPASESVYLEDLQVYPGTEPQLAPTVLCRPWPPTSWGWGLQTTPSFIFSPKLFTFLLQVDILIIIVIEVNRKIKPAWKAWDCEICLINLFLPWPVFASLSILFACLCMYS